MGRMDDTSTVILPAAAAEGPFVKVYAVDAGELTLQEKFFITEATDGKSNTVPSLSFLIEHKDARILFDGGLRHRPDDYRPLTAERIRNNLSPWIVKTDAAEYLQQHGLDPAVVDTVILSHVHYDHIGSPKTFPKARYIVGAGSLDAMSNEHSAGYDSSLFEPDLFDGHEVLELPPSSSTSFAAASETGVWREPHHTWKTFGPFTQAFDYFGDGSLYIIDAPGHMEGHINILARVSANGWVYLGGDACHDPRILTGEKGIATYLDVHGNCRSAHSRKDVAEQTIARIRRLLEADRGREEIEVILAHDYLWYRANRHRFYPQHL